MKSLGLRLDGMGQVVTKNMEYTLQVLLMVYLSFRATLVHHTQSFRTIFGVISAQIYFTGWQAFFLISILALASGSVVILQSLTNLNFIGGTEAIGNLLIIIIVREIAPLITAIVVIARSGTAVASEVGNMRANREIEALESMGINPLSFIVFPRLVGGVLSVISLGIYFVMVSILGGYFVTILLHEIPFSFYADSLSQALASEDLWLFLLKNAFSGVIIFVISCYQGLSVQRSPTEVPVVTTQAVVKSIIYVVVFNLTVTTLFYLYQLYKIGVI